MQNVRFTFHLQGLNFFLFWFSSPQSILRKFRLVLKCVMTLPIFGLILYLPTSLFKLIKFGFSLFQILLIFVDSQRITELQHSQFRKGHVLVLKIRSHTSLYIFPIVPRNQILSLNDLEERQDSRNVGLIDHILILRSQLASEVLPKKIFFPR